MSRRPQYHHYALPLSSYALVVLPLCIFVADLWLPPTSVRWLLYLIPIAFSYWSPHHHAALIVMMTSCVLLVVDAALFGGNASSSSGLVTRMVGPAACVAFVPLLYVRRVRERRQRQRYEEAVERLRGLYEALPDGLAYATLDGRLLMVNSAFEALSGLTKEELLAKTYQDLVPEAFRMHGTDLVEKLIEKGVPIEYERESIGSDGRRVPVAVTFFLVKNGRGAPVGLASLVKDITRCKKAERDLHEREHQLRAVLEEREQLAQDLHDGLIQSLYAIGLSLEEARRLLPGQWRRAADELERAIQNLNAVMRTARGYISGSGAEVCEGQQLDAALKSFVASMAAIGRVQCLCRIHRHAVRRMSRCQAHHLFYIVKEAVSNSLKYAHGHRVYVSLVEHSQGVHLRIMDDGIGFNVDSVTTGCGLRNIEARVKKMGGRLIIDSKPNRGTRLDIVIPSEIRMNEEVKRQDVEEAHGCRS